MNVQLCAMYYIIYKSGTGLEGKWESLPGDQKEEIDCIE